MHLPSFACTLTLPLDLLDSITSILGRELCRFPSNCLLRIFDKRPPKRKQQLVSKKKQRDQAKGSSKQCLRCYMVAVPQLNHHQRRRQCLQADKPGKISWIKKISTHDSFKAKSGIPVCGLINSTRLAIMRGLFRPLGTTDSYSTQTVESF